MEAPEKIWIDEYSNHVHLLASPERIEYIRADLMPRWQDKLNKPQRETIDELRKILPSAHMVDVMMRIDGEWRRFQADWLRDVIALPSFPEKG